MASMSETPHPVDLERAINRMTALALFVSSKGYFPGVASGDDPGADLRAILAELREARARTGALDGALRAEEAAQQLDVDCDELLDRAAGEGWINDPTGSCHLSSANTRAREAHKRADEMRRAALGLSPPEEPERQGFADRLKTYLASPPREEPEAGRAAGVEERAKVQWTYLMNQGVNIGAEWDELADHQRAVRIAAMRAADAAPASPTPATAGEPEVQGLLAAIADTRGYGEGQATAGEPGPSLREAIARDELAEVVRRSRIVAERRENQALSALTGARADLEQQARDLRALIAVVERAAILALPSAPASSLEGGE